jgi:hypothetical protein
MRKKGENNIICAGKIAIRLNENNDFKPDSRKSNIFRCGSIPGALTTYALFYDGLTRGRGFIVFVNKGSPLTTPLLVKWVILRFLLSWDRKSLPSHTQVFGSVQN